MTEKQQAVLETMYLMAMDNAQVARAEYIKHCEVLNTDIQKSIIYYSNATYSKGYAFATYLALKDLGFDAERVDKLRKAIDNITD